MGFVVTVVVVPIEYLMITTPEPPLPPAPFPPPPEPPPPPVLAKPLVPALYG